MSPLVRYTLLQLPGLLLIACLGWWAWSAGWVSGRTAGTLFLVWLVKDVLLYPLYRPALDHDAPYGGQALIGGTARVSTALAPVGRVHIRGESWRARSIDNAPIPRGAKVRIVDAEGLTLQVRPTDADADRR